MTGQSQHPEDEEKPRFPPFSSGRAWLWMFTGFFTVLGFGSIYSLIHENLAEDAVAQLIVGASAFFVVSAMLISQYPAGPRLGQALGIRPSHPLAIPLGFLIGLSMKLPAEQLNVWIVRAFPLPKETQAALNNALVAESTVHVVALSLTIALLAPFAEEVFFRGAVFGALRRNQVSSLRAAIVTSLGFALVHVEPRTILAVIPMAAALGTLRATSGSLLPGLAAHMAFNATAILGETLGVLPPLSSIAGSMILASSLVCLGLIACLLVVVRWHPAAMASRRVETTVEPEGDPIEV